MIRKSVWEEVFYKNSYDLIVVGGGLVGQSIAHFYKKKHPEESVLILERGQHPIGASSRNAGFTCIGSVTEHLANLEHESEESLKSKIRRRYEGLYLLRATLGDDFIQYQESGGVEIFTDQQQYEIAKNAIPMINEWLFEISGEEEVYHSETYLGIPAIYNKVEGMLHSGMLMNRLMQLNQELGIHYKFSAKVEEIDATNVTLENGSKIGTGKIAVATNAFTSELLPDVEIKPGRGYVFTTKPMGMVEWMGTFHYNKGYVYFRNLGDERMLIGGGRDQDYEGEATTEFGINPTIKDYLINFANDVLELPDNWEIDQEWSGIMAFTEDNQPIVRKVNSNTVAAVGLNGMGVAIGMQVAKEAVELFAV